MEADYSNSYCSLVDFDIEEENDTPCDNDQMSVFPSLLQRKKSYETSLTEYTAT